jgi:hypothetical protein
MKATPWLLRILSHARFAMPEALVDFSTRQSLSANTSPVFLAFATDPRIIIL